MAYCTEKDVIAVLIGRREADRNETPADLDVDQIRAAIADADAQINLNLKRRYVVPFADGTVPPLVHALSVDIASYLSTLIFRGPNGITVDDPMVLLYARAQRILSDIQASRVDIDGAVEQTSLSNAVPAVYNDYEGSLFPLYPTFPNGYIPADRLY